MKSREAAANLTIKIPPRNANDKSVSSVLSRFRGGSQMPLRPALPLNDIPPLNWKKKTPTALGKPQPPGIPQSARHDLKKKSSATDLRRRNFAADDANNQRIPRRPAGPQFIVRKKMSAPDLRRTAQDHTPGVGDCPPLPRCHRAARSLSAIEPLGNSCEPEPRFMGPQGREEKTAQMIPANVVPPKPPTITLMAPSRVKKRRALLNQVHESRVKRFMRILKHTNFKAKCKDVSKHLNGNKMLRRVHGYAKALRAASQRKGLDIGCIPQYKLKERRRVSLMFGLPKIDRLPSITSLTDFVAVDIPEDKESEEHKDPPDLGERDPNHGKDSDGSIYSEKGSKSNKRLSTIPLASAPAAQESSNARAVRVSRCDNLMTRPSMVPYQEWIDILESSGNPFFDDVSEHSAPSEISHDPTEDHPNDNILRASLVPFRDWLVVFDSNRDTLNPEDHRESLIIPPFLSNSAHLPCPSSTKHRPRFPRPYSITLKETRRSVAEVNNTQSSASHSSVVFSSTTGVMSSSSPPDPFLDQPDVEGEGLTQLESQVFANRREETTREPSDQTPSSASSQDTVQAARPNHPQKDSGKEMLARERADPGPSKIPRVPTQRRARATAASAQKRTEVTPEQQSSIPISVRKRAGRSESPQEDSGQGFSGGIRMVDRTTGFHRFAREANIQHKPESAQPDREDDSSSVSSWGNIDPEELAMKRPKGLTGENRVRPRTREELLAKYGAGLRIDPSAERLLLGKDTGTSETQGKSSLHDNRADRSLMPTSQYQSELPGSRANVSRYLEDSEEFPFPNFCRPNLESRPRGGDLSNRDMPMYRNPPLKPRSLSLGSESEHGDSAPQVPIVPSMFKSDGRQAAKSDRAVTPPEGTPEFYAEMASRVDPFTLSGSLNSHPPRSTSLQAQAGSDFTPSRLTAGAPRDRGLKPKRSNRTFDDIMQGQEQLVHNEGESKLPDSKSSRMLDGFRSIFHKNKSGPTSKEQSAGSNTKRDRNVPEKTDTAKYAHAPAKSKPKWSKSSRNLRVGDISSPIPRMPSSTLPSPGSYSSMAQQPSSRGRQAIHTPSFARPTQATRTRAAASTRQTSVAQEARMNRIKVLTPSTGSPSRLTRIQKRSNAPPPSPPSPPKSQDPQSDADAPRRPWNQLPQPDPKIADCGQVGIETVQLCIEDLADKACENAIPSRRMKNLRLALDLQQQLSDYKSVVKEAKDLEALLAQKKTDQGLALNNLMHYLDIVRIQAEELE